MMWPDGGMVKALTCDLKVASSTLSCFTARYIATSGKLFTYIVPLSLSSIVPVEASDV